MGVPMTRSIYNLLQYWNSMIGCYKHLKASHFSYLSATMETIFFLFSLARRDAEIVKRKSGGAKEENRRIWFPWQQSL